MPRRQRQSCQSFRATLRRKIAMQYLLCLPKGYGRLKKRWPLVLFLHGAGERGTDLDLVKMHGPPKLVEQGREFPFVLVAPQCPQDIWWDIPALEGLLDEIAAKYAVHPDRVYLTGLSMGGFGSWALAIDQPERFAAVAPICGGGNRHLACRLAKLPIWVFHGAKDDAVPAACSREMVAGMRKAGGKPRFTLYRDAGHDSWTATYKNPRFWQWLLKQRRTRARAWANLTTKGRKRRARSKENEERN